jgi:DNA-binding CsgD family transcriptional regulator
MPVILYPSQNVVYPKDSSVTDPELEVFGLIGQGRSTQQIAEKLQLSIKTIESHLAHIKEKLNLKSATDLMPYAIQWWERYELSMERGEILHTRVTDEVIRHLDTHNFEAAAAVIEEAEAWLAERKVPAEHDAWKDLAILKALKSRIGSGTRPFPT